MAWVVLLSFYISNNWYQLMLIQGNSMYPSYRNMQIVVLNRHDRKFSYGDVVAFSCERLSEILVKRIAACPGDTAVIQDGTLYVNGKPSEIYPQENLFPYAGLLAEPIELEQGQFLVLGDNIRESKDSRYPEVGIVSERNIFGAIV